MSICICERKCAHIATFDAHLSQAMLNIVVYQMLIVTSVPVNSAALYTLLISLGAILNFQWMTSFAERSYTWLKWLPKRKSLLRLILQCVHIKMNVFTLYQEEYFLYTMYLWVCYRNFKAFVQRYSWIDDIEDKRELI